LLLSLVREAATVLVGREIERRVKRRLAGLAATIAVLAILGLAALVFLYVFAFEAIAAALDPQSAAAILCGANLLLIALILIGRSIARRSRRRPQRPGRPDIAALAGPEMEEALAFGIQTAERLREMAPTAAIVAAILGLAVGARPELLDLLKPRRERGTKAGK